jgi:peptidoglycan/xylan/chitin deacetylase (PgdA/CDA1 family)
MFNGKMKAVTFSYDDGVTQDIRLISLLDKYSLKSTFNLNSEKFGMPGKIRGVSHNKVNAADVKSIYQNHEVAMHTLTHPRLPELPDEEVIRQVEQDRKNLSELVGYAVVGGAYPCGGVNNDERVAALIKRFTGVKYCRTIESSHSFDLQDNIYRFNPSVYHLEFDKLFEMGEEFVNLKPDSPKLFYIWGHSYEFDFENTWDKFEEFCNLISNRDDIFYGTNKEVLL